MHLRPISRVLRRAATALAAVAVAVPLIATQADAYIYWSMSSGTSGGRIGQAANTGTVVNYNLVNPTGGLAGATAIAVDSQYIYWANGPSQIGRANLDGSGVIKNFIVAVFNANALAVDSTSGFIFWADSENSRIGRAKLDGTDVETSFQSIPSKASGITVDSVNGAVYWTAPELKSIGKVNENGTGYQPYWKPQLTAAQGLTNDGTYLYWVNGTNRIGRVNLDGSGLIQAYIGSARVGIKSSSPVTTPSPILVSGGSIYYANLTDGYLGKVPNVANTLGASNYLVGILGSASGLALDQLPTNPGPLPPPPPMTIPDADVLRGTVLQIGLPHGIERSLLAKVDAFRRAVDRGDQAAACESLTAYANHLDALAGKKIPSAPADGLFADIRSFRTTLGCSTD